MEGMIDVHGSNQIAPDFTPDATVFGDIDSLFFDGLQRYG
jgi:hypothetical protein